MKSTVFLIAIFSLFTFNSEVSCNKSKRCLREFTKLKTCDELKDENDYKNFMRAFDRLYLEHAIRLHGHKTPKPDKKQKDDSNKQLHALLNILLLKFNPLLRLPDTLTEDARYGYLIKLLDYINHMKNASAICTTVATLPPITTTVDKYKCPNEFLRIGEFCYYFSTEKLAWQKALDSCEKKGGDLGHPVKAIEQKNVVKHIKSHTEMRNISNWWLGATDAEEEGTWRWTHDNSHLAFQMWLTDKPKTDGEDCMGFVADHDFKWDDFVCTETFNYICQQI